jgi:hypothetical protein
MDAVQRKGKIATGGLLDALLVAACRGETVFRADMILTEAERLSAAQHLLLTRNHPNTR